MLKAYRLQTFAILTAGLMLMPARAAQATASGQDAQIQADVQKALSKKQFTNVKVSAQNGVVTLSGTVAVYANKRDAEEKARHKKNVKRVVNTIEVAGPTVDDATLAKKLSQVANQKLQRCWSTQGVVVNVRSGVVTLGGTVCFDADKTLVVGMVANYPGVKSLNNNITVGQTRESMPAMRTVISAN